MKLSLDAVEREVSRLWEEEVSRSPAARVELLTFVALVSEAALFDRAQAAVAAVARAHPCRTIVVNWAPGAERAIVADVSLHRTPSGAACGDALVVESTGDARDWLPENIVRLALPDLPMCIWWVGDLPDYDRLFDRMLADADFLIVNSDEMDLRDLEKLSTILLRSRGRCALSDLTWVRVRPWLELVARFFDDVDARRYLPSLERITIEFCPRDGSADVASPQAALLLGWFVQAGSLRKEAVDWSRGEGWAQVKLGRVTARFERRAREGVVPGALLRVAIECQGASFEVQRQEEDADVLRWSREMPDCGTAPQTLRVATRDEKTLLVRSLELPRHDALFEASLHAASRIVRPIAPRLSGRPGSSP